MPLRIAVLTVSDRVSRGLMEDAGGVAVAERLRHDRHIVAAQSVVPDERESISAMLVEWADGGTVDVIVTTGGTGLGPRDVTPEATLGVCGRAVPGIAEAMRQEGLRHTPHAMLSRGVAAARGTTLVINLPGSPRGAVENLEVVLPVLEHAVAILHGGRH